MTSPYQPGPGYGSQPHPSYVPPVVQMQQVTGAGYVPNYGPQNTTGFIPVCPHQNPGFYPGYGHEGQSFAPVSQEYLRQPATSPYSGATANPTVTRNPTVVVVEQQNVDEPHWCVKICCREECMLNMKSNVYFIVIALIFIGVTAFSLYIAFGWKRS